MFTMGQALLYHIPHLIYVTTLRGMPELLHFMYEQTEVRRI